MREDGLTERVVKALKELGLNATILKRPKGAGFYHADAWLRIDKNKPRIDYVVEEKRIIGRATLGAVVTQLRHAAETTGHPALLVANYVTPTVAENLRKLQQQFADTAGNTYLEHPGLFVYVTGRKPLQTDDPTAGKAFTIGGLKILFALICRPDLADANQRTIATAADVALGTVPNVLNDLQHNGYLLVTEKRRRLNATRRLLDEWALAYARTLRHKTLRARYLTPHFDAWRNWQLDPDLTLWGGEPAANLLVRYLKPGALMIYAEKLPPRLLVEHQMVPADPKIDTRVVEHRKPFWNPALILERQPRTVPPALVYADLLATGDGRCIETAQMIYDGYLARLLPAA